MTQPEHPFKGLPEGAEVTRRLEYSHDRWDIQLQNNIRGDAKNETLMLQSRVRRLTPTECERLQGFPDGFTNIPWRKKPEAPDGPRYKALGNSMAVPVMAYIGERIRAVICR